MTERQQSMVRAYEELQSLRLAAKRFGVSKSTIHMAIRRLGVTHILREPYKTFKFERPKHRNRK